MTDVWSRTDGKEPRNNSPVLDHCRKLIKDGEKYLIVDVARKGKDSTVFSVFEGLELKDVQTFTKR